MTDLALVQIADQDADDVVVADADECFIPLSDPDITMAEIEAVDAVMRSPRLSAGPAVEAFEAAFAAYVGRKYAIAVPSGTLGLLIALKSYGIGPGQEVIVSPYSFRETAHAISIAGARPVFADIDYWAGTLVAGENGSPHHRKYARHRRLQQQRPPRAMVGTARGGEEARPCADRGFHRGDRLEV